MSTQETLVQTFLELHPEDAARALESADPAEAYEMLRDLPNRLLILLIERLQPHVAAEVLQQMELERFAELLTETELRTASNIVHHLDEEHREQLLAGIPESIASSIRELVDLPAETAGGMMQTKVAALALDLTVQEAIGAIRKAPRDALYYLYVTHRDGRLAGVLSMRDLLLALPSDPIEPLVRRDILSIPATMTRDEVVDVITERRFLALPVVDNNGMLIGVVKHNEVMLAGQAEAFEDMQRLVGAGADEHALSSVSVVVKSRLPWLLVNLATAFMAAGVIGMFEGMITKVAALAVLLPVVAGQGGNTGSQSLAVVMRGLALREITPGTKGRVIRKELFGGLLNGLLVALVTAVCVYGWRHFVGDSVSTGVALAAVIFLSMVVNMAIAALSGAMIPMLLQALGKDPAQSASIFLTTVTDIVGFAAFLGFASALMQWLT